MKRWAAIFYAIAAAAFYALNMPFSKLLLEEIPSVMLAGLPYLGVGAGVGALFFIRRKRTTKGVLLFAVRSTVRHFKGEGGCCGGAAYKLKKKRLPRIIGKKCFVVEGMHCENCKNRVERLVNDIDGISGKVDLKKKRLVASYAVETDDAIIIAKIERAGYKIARITE